MLVTVTAQPICLPESWSVTNNNGILVGWGKTAGQTGELFTINENRCSMKKKKGYNKAVTRPKISN